MYLVKKSTRECGFATRARLMFACVVVCMSLYTRKKIVGVFSSLALVVTKVLCHGLSSC
jgi:hypothetical protein